MTGVLVWMRGRTAWRPACAMTPVDPPQETTRRTRAVSRLTNWGDEALTCGSPCERDGANTARMDRGAEPGRPRRLHRRPRRPGRPRPAHRALRTGRAPGAPGGGTARL